MKHVFVTAVLGWIVLMGGAPDTSWSQTTESNIYLKTGFSNTADYNIPVRSNILVNNDYDQALHEVRIERIGSGKPVARIDRFAPGQTFELQFMTRGEYRICYSLKRVSNNAPRCLLINVVTLQAA